VFCVSRWFVFAWNSTTTETQRLHREEGLRDFLCKAKLNYLNEHDHQNSARRLRVFVYEF
jgi:hypothetical protein